MRFKKLLVPVDGSEHSHLALKYAIRLAEDGGQIVLMHSYGELPALVGGDSRDELIEEIIADANSLLTEFKVLLEQSGTQYSSCVVGGHAGLAILKVCEAEGCDLIVMGTRGLSDFEGMLVGSVAHKVLQHATVPVLVVR